MDIRFVKGAIKYILVFAIASCTHGKTNEELDTNSSVSTEAPQVATTKKDATISVVQSKAEKVLKEEKMELVPFTSIPDDFIGCGCSFFRSKADKDAQKYIYLDAGNIAMVKLNGEVQTFDYKENIKGITYFTNDKMQLEVNITKTIERTDLEETADVEGTFTITNGKEKLVRKFVGSCGC